jgi:hypothetical protein
MYFKDYFTYLEKYRLKGISDERSENLLRIVKRTYNKYMKYTQNNTNKIFQCIKENQV